MPPTIERKNWVRLAPYGEDSYIYWFNGIYKIVHYQTRPGNTPLWHAYYIPDHYKNWGDNVGKPATYPIGQGMTTTGWESLEKAMTVCEEHAETYTAKPSTLKRAGEIMVREINEAIERRPEPCPRSK